jgi:TM2 domain-containing membrane protein YozV
MDDKPSVSGPASGRGVNAFVLNILIPGLGAIYAGKPGIGAGQLVLFALGLILTFTIFFIGIPMVIGAWIWAAITGFQLLTSTQ